MFLISCVKVEPPQHCPHASEPLLTVSRTFGGDCISPTLVIVETYQGNLRRRYPRAGGTWNNGRQKSPARDPVYGSLELDFLQHTMWLKRSSRTEPERSEASVNLLDYDICTAIISRDGANRHSIVRALKHARHVSSPSKPTCSH